MESSEIRKKYLEFFKERGHAIVPSASLVPENDPTTLFTGSGMQPMIPYLLGAKHPLGTRIADSQKSFRAEDIEEVGDNRHDTFFEMLGNWSLGDYWKEEQLSWIFEFLTGVVGLDPQKFYVTVFAGDEEAGIPKESEAVLIWKRLFKEKGIEAKDVELITEENAAKIGMGGGRIFYYGAKKNWWSRAGAPSRMPVGEPGGPDSEMFYEFESVEHDPKFGEYCHPNCECGRYIEIGNSVFMEYRKTAAGFEKLEQRNVDFGGGLERTTAASKNDPDIFNIDTLRPLVDAIRAASSQANIRSERIVADHMRASIFFISDGILPSNKERGYVLRRIIRRAITHGRYLMGLPKGFLSTLIDLAIGAYGDAYPELAESRKMIHEVFAKEEAAFERTYTNGIKEFEKIIAKSGDVSGDDAFLLFATHGFPIELTEELATRAGKKVDREAFLKEAERHKELSRTASAGTFKGGLADSSEKTTRLHTAHHLLLKALQAVLGPTVKQRGSNITSERLRMDFSYDGKMTDEQKKEVERIVNEKIEEDLPVVHSEMPREKAETLGAEHEFGQKYPARVSVYSVGPKSATQEAPQFEKAYSIELCGGPHVSHTGEIGHFRLAKEEAVGAGIRRVKGVVD
jgi:alanyl-tRNA synthetase